MSFLMDWRWQLEDMRFPPMLCYHRHRVSPVWARHNWSLEWGWGNDRERPVRIDPNSQVLSAYICISNNFNVNGETIYCPTNSIEHGNDTCSWEFYNNNVIWCMVVLFCSLQSPQIASHKNAFWQNKHFYLPIPTGKIAIYITAYNVEKGNYT